MILFKRIMANIIAIYGSMLQTPPTNYHLLHLVIGNWLDIVVFAVDEVC